MSRRPVLKCALTVAGSDSGGGAGIQADLKTFAALGVHGACAITCLTAQNPRRVLGVEECPAPAVRRQLEAVFEELPPTAVKTGMLYSAPIITAVAEFFRHRKTLLVVDPVMVATSGARLLQPAAIRGLCEKLLPMATLITPNLPEAEALVGQSLRSLQDLRAAARRIHRQFHCAALVKGGHLGGLREAVDIFYDGQQEFLLSAPRIRGVRTHGTGCAYSAAITAWLARGKRLDEAVGRAKEFVTQAIAQGRAVAGHDVLNFSPRARP